MENHDDFVKFADTDIDWATILEEEEFHTDSKENSQSGETHKSSETSIDVGIIIPLWFCPFIGLVGHPGNTNRASL